MDKRYQVFISSTFNDLIEERKAIIETLLKAKYIPAGMEMFSASNDEQFIYIKKIIDDCDYYILIMGGRYGSINSSTGKSFTEQEYDYAISKNIPVLVFLHDNPFSLPYEKRDDKNREPFELFREKASKNRLCKMWNNTVDLISTIVISLVEESAENPQLGWIRGSTYDSVDLLSQINILRIENELHKKEIERLNRISYIDNIHDEDLASGSDKYLIKGIGYQDKVFYKGFTWDEIFSAIGPYLVSSCNYKEFCNHLDEAINSISDLYYHQINSNCEQTIKIQLQALGLLDVELVNVGDKNIELIRLTSRGERYLIQIKSIKKK